MASCGRHLVESKLRALPSSWERPSKPQTAPTQTSNDETEAAERPEPFGDPIKSIASTNASTASTEEMSAVVHFGPQRLPASDVSATVESESDVANGVEMTPRAKSAPESPPLTLRKPMSETHWADARDDTLEFRRAQLRELDTPEYELKFWERAKRSQFKRLKILKKTDVSIGSSDLRAGSKNRYIATRALQLDI